MGLAVRVTELGVERFGVCQAAPCLGVFIDTSTNRSRRYCSERCVSRANVTAFRARKRVDGSGPADPPGPGQNAGGLDETGTP
jgi:predicted RNA-binding Zn ribbon-like protein